MDVAVVVVVGVVVTGVIVDLSGVVFGVLLSLLSVQLIT